MKIHSIIILAIISWVLILVAYFLGIFILRIRPTMLLILVILFIVFFFVIPYFLKE